MTRTPPAPLFVKTARARLQMSVREFEESIGYDADGRICMALESGVRGGRPFELTGPAERALAYLTAIVGAYDRLQADDPVAAEAILRLALPVKLQ